MSSTSVHHGSCHCGNVQYQIRLKFPPVLTPGAESIRLYKCNCTVCHKMGFFHCRPISPADDFIVTSPSIEELGDYRVFAKKTGWYFCKSCGVRTFGVSGKWVQEEIDVEKWAGREGGEGKMQKVWRTEPKDIETEVDGKTVTKKYHYTSVNAVTLEPGGNVNLIEWHEKGWLYYVDSREETGEDRAQPHHCGMY
ncbi:hypothetical protein K505DRAFT_328536 [Melanomma pulvis-pyrius CBS 109.77]|uniref:CENP-V/GFA domain-containing protein n=1 Tax=Melanomma pulvis-pyrius CBS 109.77 TaxID=1314802 RepID=A0A6A6WYJ5_9PLEO|nr:hypothetical protein K505DRAFT_328536 [Melanomma pulvis-pyrius CBS 109.77]